MAAWQHFFERAARVIRLPDGFMLAPGRNTTDETCTEHQEGPIAEPEADRESPPTRQRA
jgi:hypothetical protein